MPIMPIVCAKKGCNTVLASCNPNDYCFVHIRKALVDEVEKADHELLKKSKKFKQISTWVQDYKKLRHFKLTMTNLLLCRKENKSKKVIEYAVFAKTLGKGIKRGKRDLAAKISF